MPNTDEAADHQLQPAGVGDAARHLIRDQHNRDGINAGGSRIHAQQPVKTANSRNVEVGSE